MRFTCVIFLICITAAMIGQNNFFLGLSVNYPVLKNHTRTLTNSLTRSSLLENISFNEKPGLTVGINYEIPFLFKTLVTMGFDLNWINYSFDYNEYNIYKQNPYLRENQPALLKEYKTDELLVNTNVIYLAIPVFVKYPLLAEKVFIQTGLSGCILAHNQQKLTYLTQNTSSGQRESRTSYTNKGLNNFLLYANVGVVYNINGIFSAELNNSLCLLPLYEKNYQFIEDPGIFLFNLSVKYQLPY